MGGRNKAIDDSPFRDEIRAMLKEKGHASSPTYEEVSDQIEERFGESYSVQQLQRYMNEEIRPDERMPPQAARDEMEERQEVIDIAKKRAELVKIQEERRKKAMETEEEMAGMLLDQASDMIRLEDELLDSLSEDYERLGILDSVSDIDIDVEQKQENPFAMMLEQSLMKELSDDDDADETEHYDYTTVDDVAPEEEESDESSDPHEQSELEKDPEEIDLEDLDVDE